MTAQRKARKITARASGTLAVAITAGLVLAGCAGGPEKNFADGFSATAAIGQVPAPADAKTSFRIFGSNIEGALAAAHTASDSAQWLTVLSGQANQSGDFAPVYAEIPGAFASGTNQVLGWSFAKSNQFVTFTALPTTLTVLRGEKLVVPDSFSKVGDGITSDVDAPDFATDLEKKDHTIDAIGRPTRIAQQGALTALTTSTDAAKAWLNRAPSLAENASVAAIAKALDEQKVLSFSITQPAKFSGELLAGPDSSPADAQAALKKFDALVPPAPYDMTGIGWSVKDGKALWVAAYHFNSAQEASDGSQVLRAVWEKGSSITNQRKIAEFAKLADVKVDDTTVTVTLRPTDKTSPAVLSQLFNNREVLFASR